jgi:hypothetical protein
MQVVGSGHVCLTKGEGILTAIQRNTIPIIRHIPNMKVTLMSGITSGLLYEGNISVWISLLLQIKYFFKDISMVFNQNTHKEM